METHVNGVSTRAVDDRVDALGATSGICRLPQGPLVPVWSTKPLERLNKEIKRRARVVGIFPNEASVIRLVGVVLADVHDEWQADDRRYLSTPSATLSTSPNSTPATDTEDHPRGPPPGGTKPTTQLFVAGCTVASTPASVRRPIKPRVSVSRCVAARQPCGRLGEEPFLDELGQGRGWKGLGERNIGCYLQIGQR